MLETGEVTLKQVKVLGVMDHISSSFRGWGMEIVSGTVKEIMTAVVYSNFLKLSFKIINNNNPAFQIFTMKRSTCNQFIVLFLDHAFHHCPKSIYQNVVFT